MEAGAAGVSELRFDPQVIDAELMSDPGSGFQDFAFQLLRRSRPSLRRYPAAGKDGGIDLIEGLAGGRGAFECKYIGADGIATARARWNEVADKLTTHLPEKSQSQYAPWWDTESPILEYTFCVSSVLPNESNVEALEKEIGGVLTTLANAHSHLRHLRDVRVRVMHWPDLLTELEDAPDLVFRWFPKTRPLGLVPLSRPGPRSLFSSFLDSANLGYYSRDAHIAAHGRPDHIDVATEMELLERLSETVGLIITGPGGHGKTRLVHELGLLAELEGWCVLRVSGPWRRESLERLGQVVGDAAPVLLLFDYIELQQTFDDAISDLVDLHETYGLRIKYVANCRSSFYLQVAHHPLHEEVPLAPVQGVEWFREFRRAVVRHILDAGGVGVEPRTLQVCRDVPVLAVFLSYLARSGRTDDLHELLNERDFGKWVRLRLASSFPGDAGHEVAAMISQFPVREEVAHRLAPVEILSTLEKDGWIERQASELNPEAREWVVVHDVLADQLLVMSMAEHGSFAVAEIGQLLTSALENGTLASLLSSLQRIRDHPEVEGLDFSSIIRDRFASDPQAWIDQAPSLLGSSLLAPVDAIAMLESGRAIWKEHLVRQGVRQHIGWLAREVADDRESEPALAVLEWLQEALAIEETDYLLRSGLVLAPAETAARAARWITARPTDFSTQFVINSWLLGGLPPERIAASVQAWLEVHGEHPRAWYVLAPWFSAGGDRELVTAAMLRWLELHRTMRQGAAAVLFNWLKAGGSRDAVEPHVLAWLETNETSPEGRYVIGGWLEAGADLEQAAPLMDRWLRVQGGQFDARFVFAAWLNRDGSIEAVREYMETWLGLHSDKPESAHVGDDLVRALPKTPELIATVFECWPDGASREEFGQVLSGWLLTGGTPEPLQPHLDTWLSRFGMTLPAGGIYVGWLSQDDYPTAVREAAVDWFVAFPTNVQAGHLSKIFVGEEELDLETARAVVRWCAAFPDHEDALWRLTQMRYNLHEEGLKEDVLTAIEAVSAATLTTDLSPLRATQLTTLCSLLTAGKAFQTGVAGDRCDTVLLDCLRHPGLFEHGGEKLTNAQRPALVRRFLAMVLRGWLDPQEDMATLKRLLAWVSTWEEPNRGEALVAIDHVMAIDSERTQEWRQIRVVAG
jgi:hypothetical protein